jgi:hypothetical protein
VQVKPADSRAALEDLGGHARAHYSLYPSRRVYRLAGLNLGSLCVTHYIYINAYTK